MNWLTVHLPQPYLILVTSQKEYDKVFTHLKASPDVWLDPGLAACVTELEGTRGGQVIVVSIRITDNEADMVSTLVHESVHVKQRWLRHWGEDTPGVETEAYMTETIFTALTEALTKKLKKGKKKCKKTVTRLKESTNTPTK